jgi:hypothetical protein
LPTTAGMNCDELIAVFPVFGNFVFLDIASLTACSACSVLDSGIVYYFCLPFRYIFTEAECYLSCNSSYTSFILVRIVGEFACSFLSLQQPCEASSECLVNAMKSAKVHLRLTMMMLSIMH